MLKPFLYSTRYETRVAYEYIVCMYRSIYWGHLYIYIYCLSMYVCQYANSNYLVIHMHLFVIHKYDCMLHTYICFIYTQIICIQCIYDDLLEFEYYKKHKKNFRIKLESKQKRVRDPDLGLLWRFFFLLPQALLERERLHIPIFSRYKKDLYFPYKTQGKRLTYRWCVGHAWSFLLRRIWLWWI